MGKNIQAFINKIKTLCTKETYSRWLTLATTKYRNTTIATGIVIFLITISVCKKSTYSWFDFLIGYPLIITLTAYYSFNIQTYGVEKSIERSIELYFSVLFAIIELLKQPFRLLKKGSRKITSIIIE